MLFTLHYAIKFNINYCWWFFIFIFVHLFFFIYWYFDSLGWVIPRDKKHGMSVFDISFNPFTGRIKKFNDDRDGFECVTDEVKNDLIETNIYLSMNVLTMLNVMFFIFYLLAFLLVHRRF